MKRYLSILAVLVSLNSYSQLTSIRVASDSSINIVNPSTGVSLRLILSRDTAAMLSGDRTAINKNTDSIAAHNIRLGVNTANIALKKNSADSVSTVATDYVTHHQLKKTSDSVFNNAVHNLPYANVRVVNALNTTENTAITITIPANTIGPNGSLHFIMLDSVTNNANNKITRLKINGTTIGTSTLTTSSLGRAYWSIHNNNSLTAQSAFTFNTNSGTTFNGATTGGILYTTFDFSVSNTITVTQQAASAGDRMAVESFQVVVYP